MSSISRGVMVSRVLPLLQQLSRVRPDPRAFFFVSRHAALPVLRRGLPSSPRTLAAQLASLFSGALCIGVAVNLMVGADLGLAPYDVLSAAVADLTRSSLGLAGMVVAAALFLTSSLLGHRPGPWAVGYIVANAVAIDLVATLVPDPAAGWARALYLAAAIALMAAGVNLVLSGGTTGGAFELLMAAGAERGVSPTLVRYGLDAGCFALGVALGGPVGVATVVYGASFGLTLQLLRQTTRRRRTTVNREAALAT